MLSEANFLILDEPTNHLDITSKEILENALQSYTGTVFYVSHDRYFINQTATRILELTGQTLINYIGNYDYYLEKRETMAGLYGGGASAPAFRTGSSSDSKAAGSLAGNLQTGLSLADASGKAQASQAFCLLIRHCPNLQCKTGLAGAKGNAGRIRKRQNDLKKTEDQIHLLETRDSEIGELLQREEIYTDVAKLMELNQEKQDIQDQLEALYERWEELAQEE